MKSEKYGKCAECPLDNDRRICKTNDGFGPDYCSTKNYKEVLAEADLRYREEQYAEFTRQAAIQEFECYESIPGRPGFTRPKNPRIVEIYEFCKKMGYKRLGLAFCSGLREEAAVVERIFRDQGFDVVSVICKVGCRDKRQVGLTQDQKIAPEADGHESMCNPIAQALILNKEKTDFNIVLGLCVGHDSMFLKNSEALCTILAVKDRVTGHNPLAPVYTSGQYYRYIK
jgi:uncharacterized metal-binding protein